MTSIGDVLAGIRRILLVEHRIDSIAGDLDKLTEAHDETRERLIRVEVIIEEARRSAGARRLPGD